MDAKEYYKSQIIDIITGVDNLKYLKFIYDLLMSFRRKWKV